jgi:LPS export ABC transporter protein LptC
MGVNINGFLLMLSALLLGIYVFFKPMNLKPQDADSSAMLELKNFKLCDIGAEGLNMMLHGSSGKRFEDHYEISDVNYSNQSAPKVQKMRASQALYQDKILYLNGDVMYAQGDDFTFKSDEAMYNEQTKRATTKEQFTLQSHNGNFKGRALLYNSQTQHVKAEKISVEYQLQ